MRGAGYAEPMGWGRRVAAVAAVLLLGGVLAGCASPMSGVVPDSTVTVAFDEPFTSLNATSTASATEANRELAQAVLAGFSAVDGNGDRVPDPSFGTIAVLDRDPLTVRYTVADGVRWSDGVPVDAVDLLLTWAAESGAFPAFASDRSAVGLALSSALPEISADRKSLTVVYSVPYADYPAQFDAVLPAHVVAREALGASTPDAAKDALIDAVKRAVNGDAGDLDRIAAWWSGGFALDAGPDVLVSDGPYRIDSSEPGAQVVLVPNREYIGAHAPRFGTVRLVSLDPPAALQGLEAGAVQVVSLDPTADAGTTLAVVGAAVLAGGDSATRLVATTRTGLAGVAPAPDGTGLLWNLWQWSPGR